MITTVVFPDLHKSLLENLESIERSLIERRLIFLVELLGYSFREVSLATQERVVLGIEAFAAHGEGQEDCQENKL